MKSFKALPATILFLIGTISASAAFADVIKFDDITTNVSTAVPGQYQGFSWTNLRVVVGDTLNPKLGLGPGFANSIVSGSYVAYAQNSSADSGFFR